MVVQPRDNVYRCFLQHDHALVSGEAAARWVGDCGRRPDAVTCMAVATHDIGWTVDDRRPVFDPERQRPYDFMTAPADERLAVYRRGIDEMEALHPYAGLLGSMHFSAFVTPEEDPAFVAEETARRARLRAVIERGVAGTGARLEHAEEDYALLRAMDLLSLVVCLSAPGSDPTAYPRWIHAPLTVSGRARAMRWDDAAAEPTLRVEAFPFDGTFTLEVPYRDIPRRAYPDSAALDRAWDAATTGVLAVRIAPA